MKTREEIKQIIANYSSEEMLKHFSFKDNENSLMTMLSIDDLFNEDRITSSDIALLSIEDLKEIFSKLSEDELRKILFNPKEISINTIVDILSFVPLSILVDYIIKKPKDTFYIATLNFDILKQLFANGIIFDILDYKYIETIIDTCKDEAYLINLMLDEKVFDKFSTIVKNSIVEKYFAKYPLYNSSRLNRVLEKYVSARRLAILYKKYNPIRASLIEIRNSKKSDSDLTEYERQVKALNESSLEDEMFLLKNFIHNLTFKKMVLFIYEMNLDEEKSLSLLNRFYKELVFRFYPNFTFKEIYDEEIETKKLLITETNKKDDDITYLKPLLPDFEELPFDEDLFFELFYINVNGGDEITKSLFYSQLITYVEQVNNIKVNRNMVYGISFSINELLNSLNATQKISSRTCGSYSKSNNILSVNTNLNLQQSTTENYATNNLITLLDAIVTCFHEIRHAKQKEIVRDDISMLSLSFALEEAIISCQPEYYGTHYKNLFVETDARCYGYQDAIDFLNTCFSSKGYLNPTQILETLYQKEYSEDRFITDHRRETFVIRFYCLKESFELFIKKEKLKDLKDRYPILKYVVDENGKFFSPDEISYFMETDLEPKVKEFYQQYLTYGYGISQQYFDNKKNKSQLFSVEDLLNIRFKNDDFDSVGVGMRR